VTSRQGTDGTYTYDSLNMLTSVRSRTMIYDANDERIGVIIDNGLSRWTLRDFQGRAIREYKGEPMTGEAYWTWEQDYVYGESELIGGERVEWSMEDQNGVETEFGGLRHYHLDHLGSVRLVTNGAKRAVSEHDYFPYGVTSTKTYQEQINWGDPHVDAMRYAGHQRDFLGYLNAENNDYLDYMHARYYDPNLGRFLSVDPKERRAGTATPQIWNRYSYALSNPIKLVDPDGRDPEAFLLVTGKTLDPLRHSAVYVRDTAPGAKLDLVYSHGGQASGVGSLKSYLGAYDSSKDPTAAYRLNLSPQEVTQLKSNLDSNYTITNGHYVANEGYDAASNNCAHSACNAIVKSADLNIVQKAAAGYMNLIGAPYLTMQLFNFLAVTGLVETEPVRLDLPNDEAEQ
jgi:RHS repeat-associated protein